MPSIGGSNGSAGVAVVTSNGALPSNVVLPPDLSDLLPTSSPTILAAANVAISSATTTRLSDTENGKSGASGHAGKAGASSYTGQGGAGGAGTAGGNGTAGGDALTGRSLGAVSGNGKSYTTGMTKQLKQKLTF